jgi:hypothetical protein
MPRLGPLLNRRNDSVNHLTRYLCQLLFKRFVFAPFMAAWVQSIALRLSRAVAQDSSPYRSELRSYRPSATS